MGLLTAAELEVLVTAGCTACASKKLTFESYVDAKLGLQEGEPVTRLTWAYDGEAFCDGIYRVACAACSTCVFSASVCPRCHAPDGLQAALESENDYVVPRCCPRCDREEITYFAMVPATTSHEGKRAEKARTDTELLDPGFHGYKAACKDCGVFAERKDSCMLCGAPAPLRERA